ncbi:MAG: aminoacyl-tRNA hydrolase [Syntrophomonadaceae bacterium]|jgi:PTH1 family peptidyl-tRNA hydrolase|nr:aminoacyl-tRNA hydrolase [Syntrophomonadaceae bacterium]
MKILVGLGNPGQKFRDSRHNMGYRVIEEIARRYPIEREECKFDSIIGHLRIHGELILIVKPLTYMNLSGRAVQPLLRFYKQELSGLIVAYDDMDLEPGRIRLRPAGGSGGHKGVASIIERLGSGEFPRLRIGIGRPPQQWTVESWVLSKPSSDEQILMENAIQQGTDALVEWVKAGIVQAMNKYN